MAKRRGGARRRRYLKGNVDEKLGLGTLAASTLISDIFDETVNERCLVSSLVASYSLDNLTTPQGPIEFGVAHSDYTDAEIEEVIENTGSWNEGGLVEQEIAKRKIRKIGTFASSTPVTSASTTNDIMFNDGKPVKTKLNWVLLQGQSLRIWAYNHSSSALTTTVPVITVAGHVNLWPQ